MDPNHHRPALPDLAAAVVAWHNRHPLARRIDADQVRGLGVVALPFTANGARTLGKVVLAPSVARRRGQSAGTDPGRATVEPAVVPAAANGLHCAFTEDFIAPLTPRQVALFALRHGHAEHPGPADCPQRDVAMADAAPRTLPVVRFVHSAAIEFGAQRRRVLIGAGARRPVLGRRLWSRSRLLAASGGLAGLLLACVLPWIVQPGGPDPTPLLASSPLVDAAAANSNDGPPVAMGDKPTPPDIRPRLSNQQRQAAHRLSAELRATRVSAAAIETASAPATSASGPAAAFAVVTPATRSRTGAQLRIVLMDAPTSAEVGRPRAEVMRVGSGWRAVLWPFDSREAAEQTREALNARGIPAEVIEF